MRSRSAMTGLLLALLLNSSPGTGTYGLRLVDADVSRSPGRLTDMTLEYDRPSLASVIVPMSFGVLFALAGSGGTLFGLAMILMSGNSVYSGIAVGIGVISAGVGALVLIGGVVCIMMATRNYKARGASDDDEPKRFRFSKTNPYVVESLQVGPASPLITIASF